MQAPEQVVSAITEDDLKGLSPRELVALVARAAWRVLPEARERPQQEAAVAWLAAMDVMAAGQDDDLAMSAIDRAETLVGSDMLVPAGLSVPLLRSVRDQGDVAEALPSLLQLLNGLTDAGLFDEAESLVEALRVDVSEWQGSHVSQGSVRPLFQHPLWLTRTGETPPSYWQRAIEQWYSAKLPESLAWLPSHYSRLLKGGGPDLEQERAFLARWLQEQEPAASVEAGDEETVGHAATGPARKKAAKAKKSPESPTDPDAKVAPKPAPDPAPEPTPAPEQKPEDLPGGIVTAAADTPATEDHLGRTPLVHTLADMLASPSQALPMTIALLGDWGSGKSSVVAQLRRRLEHLAREDNEQFGSSGEHQRNHYLFAEFNAWEYEQTDNLRAGLAQEVVNGLTDGLDRWQKVTLALTKAAKGNTLEFGMTLGGLALVILGLIFGVNLATPDEAEPLLKAAGVLSGGGVLAFSAYLMLHTWRTGRRLLEHPLATQMATYLKLPSYGKHLGEVPVIKREIRDLCEERLAGLPNGRLLVVVDDLDRCHPNAVIETLDAIRLVMNLPQVAVIVAVDDRIAFRAVADHYDSLAGDGGRSKEEIARDYLGKIIQLPVNLYEPWPSEVGEFVRGYLFDVDETAAVPEQSTPTAVAPQAKSGKPPKVSASAQRLAEAQGVDVTVIPASGKDGSVTLADVQRYLKRRADQAVVPDIGQGEASPLQPPESIKMAPIEPPPQQTPQQDQQREQALTVLMRDTLTERELFADLTNAMGVTNPRQLIRLRNSYRLLKGYRHSRGSEVTWPVLEKLMHCLFWYEFLYQHRLEARQHAELVMWLWGDKPHWQQEADKRHNNPPLVNMAQRLWQVLPRESWGQAYREQMSTVAMVVLPNAEMRLTLDRPRADALLRAQSSDGAMIEPDPWQGGFRPVPGKGKK